jgi:hypothetical protein
MIHVASSAQLQADEVMPLGALQTVHTSTLCTGPANYAMVSMQPAARMRVQYGPGQGSKTWNHIVMALIRSTTALSHYAGVQPGQACMWQTPPLAVCCTL